MSGVESMAIVEHRVGLILKIMSTISDILHVHPILEKVFLGLED
jgi:hypothetical protein